MLRYFETVYRWRVRYYESQNRSEEIKELKNPFIYNYFVLLQLKLISYVSIVYDCYLERNSVSKRC